MFGTRCFAFEPGGGEDEILVPGIRRPRPSAGTESLAGTPDMGAADAVKDDVYTLTREAVNFFHEVLMLVINWDTAQGGNGGCAPR
jgi:hypothetical protein